MSASVNLLMHHKVQKFSGTGSPEWSLKKGRETVVVVRGGKTTTYGAYSLETLVEPVAYRLLGHLLLNGKLQFLTSQQLLQLETLADVHRTKSQHAGDITQSVTVVIGEQFTMDKTITEVAIPVP